MTGENRELGDYEKVHSGIENLNESGSTCIELS